MLVDWDGIDTEKGKVGPCLHKHNKESHSPSFVAQMAPSRGTVSSSTSHWKGALTCLELDATTTERLLMEDFLMRRVLHREHPGITQPLSSCP